MPMTKPMTGMVQNAPVLHATSYDRTSVQDGILHIGVGDCFQAGLLATLWRDGKIGWREQE